MLQKLRIKLKKLFSQKLAAWLLVIGTNVILFPFVFFLSGGMDYPLVFGGALTNPKLENIGLYSYNLFKNADYSYGIAMRIMNSIVTIVLICLGNAAAKKVRGESIV